jgi:hypothetical protein
MTTIHLQKVNSAPIDQGLLNQALAFFSAASRVSADIRITPVVTHSPMAPTIVCYAFAVELYLKLLHVVANGQPTHGHKLETLFSTLPEDFRTEIAAHYPGKLVEDIAFMSNAFVTWRYEHEHDALAINPNALALLGVACHRVVRNRRPDLKVFGENVPIVSN